MLVDFFHQPQALHHQMHGSNPTAIDRLHSLGHLIVNVAGIEHRVELLLPVLGRQPALDSVLAIPENLWVGSAHSKWPFVGCLLLSTTTVQPMFAGISSFFVFWVKKSRLLHG
jgi:hypothetical protein